jgi:hypothetical protein
MAHITSPGDSDSERVRVTIIVEKGIHKARVSNSRGYFDGDFQEALDITQELLNVKFEVPDVPFAIRQAVATVKILEGPA